LHVLFADCSLLDLMLHFYERINDDDDITPRDTSVCVCVCVCVRVGEAFRSQGGGGEFFNARRGIQQEISGISQSV